ncbi:unnamed protein product, partial [Chrysoparadoxa australica]
LLGPQLDSLSFSYCQPFMPEKGLGVLLGATMRLKTLVLAGCSGVGDAHVSVLAGCCPGIEMLDLSGSIDLTGQGLQILGRRCNSLRSIKCSSCPGISDEGVEELLAGCPGLLELAVSCCPGVTGTAFLDSDRGKASMARSTNLTKVDVSHCQHLLPDALKWIAAGTCSLVELQSAHCPP